MVCFIMLFLFFAWRLLRKIWDAYYKNSTPNLICRK